uniref:Uncharacterized protein n=1 Tax=Meleagris gallopavo TaxID=9103 RepID=A0A803XNQ7_MELGA
PLFYFQIPMTRNKLQIRAVCEVHLPTYLLTYQHKAMPATHKFQHVPVKHIVIGEALSVRIVRFVIKTKRTAEVQVRGKFKRDHFMKGEQCSLRVANMLTSFKTLFCMDEKFLFITMV